MDNIKSKYLNWTDDKEREQMFEYWCQVRLIGGIAEVARKFKRSRSTVTRASQQGNWKERFNRIKEKNEKKLDNAIGKRESENLRIVRAIKSKIVAELADKLKAGTYVATVSELITLIRLEEDLKSDGGFSGAKDSSTVNITQIFEGAIKDKSEDDKTKLAENIHAIYGKNVNRFKKMISDN